MTIRPLTRSPRRLLRATAAGWPVSGQQHARHNALVASTALLARRAERLEVEQFLREHASRRQHADEVRHPA